MWNRDCKRWCESEKVMLEVTYPFIATKILAERFGASYKAVERQAGRQKLKKDKEARKTILKDAFATRDSRTEREPIYIGDIKYIYCPNHPKATENSHGRVAEHILVMEQKLGRYLNEDERVFHKDKNSLNNDPDNLYIVKCTYRKLLNEQEIIEKRKSGVAIKQLQSEYDLTNRTLYKILSDNNCVGIEIDKNCVGSKKEKPSYLWLGKWEERYNDNSNNK